MRLLYSHICKLSSPFFKNTKKIFANTREIIYNGDEVFKMNDVGTRIKHRRKELGYSAEKLAEMVGVSPATIYRYEKNEIANMGADKLRPIAKALGTTPGALMGWETDDSDEEEAFELREQLRRDPNRRMLLSLAKHGSAQDVRQAAALIDALRKTNPDFYDDDDPS